MADQKISELTELTTPANDDVLAIVDTSSTETKKITQANVSTSVRGDIVAADIPDLSASKITTGVFPNERLSADTPTDGQVLSWQSSNDTMQWVDQSGGGTQFANQQALEDFITNKADFRSDIGAGTSSLVLGTTSTTALAGNTSIPDVPDHLTPSDATTEYNLQVTTGGVATWVPDTGGGGSFNGGKITANLEIEKSLPIIDLDQTASNPSVVGGIRGMVSGNDRGSILLDRYDNGQSYRWRIDAAQTSDVLIIDSDNNEGNGIRIGATDANLLLNADIGRLKDIPNLPNGNDTTFTRVLQITGAIGSESYSWVAESGGGSVAASDITAGILGDDVEVGDQNQTTGIKYWSGTKAQYDAITADDDTIYYITDEVADNTVAANPGGTNNTDLTSISIGDTDYDIAGGHTIQNNGGTDQTQRTNLRFANPLTVTDDSANDRTTIDITLAETDIPSLATSKITSGTFDVGRIPDLAASKITSGEFDTARIPNLAASKITSGVFDNSRLSADTPTDGQILSWQSSDDTMQWIDFSSSFTNDVTITKTDPKVTLASNETAAIGNEIGRLDFQGQNNDGDFSYARIVVDAEEVANGDGRMRIICGYFGGNSTQFTMSPNDGRITSHPALYVAQGLRVGGTGAANNFDDYEEGTWTPTARAFTATDTSITDFTNKVATYTKIGDMVYCRAKLGVEANTSTTDFAINFSSFMFEPANGSITGGITGVNGGGTNSTSPNSADGDGLSSIALQFGTSALEFSKGDDSSIEYQELSGSTVWVSFIYRTGE